MKLTVTRLWFTEKSTIGTLDIDGVFECYTLEPSDPAELIPCGTYPLRLLPSEKFGRYMPFIIGVPGHAADELHIGNDPNDTNKGWGPAVATFYSNLKAKTGGGG